MAAMDCPHPSPLSESQDWYRPQEPSAESRRVSGYHIKKRLRHRDIERSYVNKILAARRRKLYDEAIALLLLEKNTVTAALPAVDVKERFRKLADEWEKEVGNVSSLTAMARHQKYRQIVDLGWDVVPLMLDDLRRNRGFWFPALNEITGIQPFDLSDAGNSKRMIEAWVQWGKRKKLIKP
jgi:hypothetical protein